MLRKGNHMNLQNQDIDIELASAEAIFSEIDKLAIESGGDFEIINREIDGENFNVFKNLFENLPAMYKTVVEIHADAEFLVYLNQRYSFNDIYQQASAFAQSLQQDYNIKVGDSVVLAMRNYPEWIMAFMAITSIGGIVVPLNAWWQREEFTYAIEHCEASLVIADDCRFVMLKDWLLQHSIPAIVARGNHTTKGATDFEQLVSKNQNQAMPEVSLNRDSTACIFYTSGSTGLPKGAVSSHESLLTSLHTWAMLGTGAAIANNTINEEPPNAPCALMTVPLFHVTACHVLFLLSLYTGRKTVMMHKWDALEALKLIEQEKITYFNGVPTMSLELMGHPQLAEFNTRSLTDISAGGAARPADHVRKLYEKFELGFPSTGYGLTETNALGSVNGGGDYVYKPNSVGIATRPIVDIKILNEVGSEVKQGEHGEICIKSISNVTEYWRNPEATQASFFKGYFRTGDLGYKDQDGFVYIVDRVKDIIIRGGENISCLEVEAEIYKHPSIKENSVFALPDERLGEIVGAVVQLKPSALIDIEQLLSFLAERLASFKVPAYVWVTEQPLPRLGSGKINKKQLKATYAEKLLAPNA
jgi:acyl-CoA synthetase (AMP-forming)/AMP-acid ligase II